MVTYHMIRSIEIKYPRSKRRLRYKGCRITRLSHSSNRQGGLHGYLKPKEINILSPAKIVTLVGGTSVDQRLKMDVLINFSKGINSKLKNVKTKVESS